MRVSSIALAFVAIVCVGAVSASFTPKLEEAGTPQLYRKYRNSSLYHVPVAGYEDPVLVANLHGANRRQLAYDYGVLLFTATQQNFQAIMNFLTPNIFLQGLINMFMDWQYDSYVTKQLPAEFKQEIAGMAEAGLDLGDANFGHYITRGITVGGIATGDVIKDIEWLLCNELNLPCKKPTETDAAAPEWTAEMLADLVPASAYPLGATADSIREAALQLPASILSHTAMAQEVHRLTEGMFRRRCSMWGAWGPRTQGKRVFTGRNLDWESDTGISKNKLLVIWNIPGKIPYVNVGFAGITGALTGMSAAGITVHEAGNDNTEETLEGFVWHLRLRALMETCQNHAEALKFWAATNNTMGLNHGIGSAIDQQFLVMETKQGYTAVFHDNDEREANYTYNGKKYGAPMPNAVWRSNHGYDQKFLSTAMYSHPGQDTETRYMIIHDTIKFYEGHPMTVQQAVNVTATPAPKGDTSVKTNFFDCSNKDVSTGTNILSVTYDPSNLVLYAAWENGHAQNRLPAACNPYVKFDMKSFFGK